MSAHAYNLVVLGAVPGTNGHIGGPSCNCISVVLIQPAAVALPYSIRVCCLADPNYLVGLSQGSQPRSDCSRNSCVGAQ